MCLVAFCCCFCLSEEHRTLQVAVGRDDSLPVVFSSDASIRWIQRRTAGTIRRQMHLIRQCPRDSRLFFESSPDLSVAQRLRSFIYDLCALRAVCVCPRMTLRSPV